MGGGGRGAKKGGGLSVRKVANMQRYATGFRPIILEILILRYELKGKVRKRPKILWVVLGQCAQFYPCKASE